MPMYLATVTHSCLCSRLPVCTCTFAGAYYLWYYLSNTKYSLCVRVRLLVPTIYGITCPILNNIFMVFSNNKMINTSHTLVFNIILCGKY